MASSACRWRAGAAALLAVVALAGTLGAQTPPPAPPAPDVLDPEPAAPVGTLPDGTRRVAGRVVTPRDSVAAPVPGEWVTLHRVGRDAAGPVDSVRSGRDGAFAFRYRPTGAADAVYFVAVSRGGVAYFSPPLRHAVVEGEEAEVTVFDTTSRPLPLTVRGRHLIVSAPDRAGAREVLEVFELSNDSTLTAVPPAGTARGVWATPLPPRATRFAVRESGDVPPDGLAVLGGAATLLAPVAPGIKQVAFSYQLPAGALPIVVDLERPTGVLEVLVEDSATVAAGAGLRAVAPVALEGRTFRRFMAEGAPAGARVTVSGGAEAAAGDASRFALPAILTVVGGGMAAALVVAGRRRPRTPALAPIGGAPLVANSSADAPAAPAPSPRDRLLAELAALDDAFAAQANGGAAARAVYEARRSAIKARLASEMAGVGTAE